MKLLSNNDYEKLKIFLLEPSDNSAAISFVNPFSYYLLKNSKTAKEIDGFFIDGLLLIKCLNVKLNTNYHRISFDYSSIAGDFLQFCEKNYISISFIGGSTSDIIRFNLHLKKLYPSLIVPSLRHGYFSNQTDLFFYFKNLPKSDVIILGMGAPLQEEVAILAKKQKISKLILTCGGFISQTAMRDDYYYPIVKKLNLRWAQRIILHKHVRRKVISTYPIFLIKFLIESLKYKINKCKKKY
jgi:UDP-N-acetyl-D-mannosaminuronic acid transferase (WecB/TagA/CpsF family)